MSVYYLKDIILLTERYGGKTNPSIWVKDDLGHDSYVPSNIYIDDYGDVIIEVNSDLLMGD